MHARRWVLEIWKIWAWYLLNTTVTVRDSAFYVTSICVICILLTFFFKFVQLYIPILILAINIPKIVVRKNSYLFKDRTLLLQLGEWWWWCRPHRIRRWWPWAILWVNTYFIEVLIMLRSTFFFIYLHNGNEWIRWTQLGINFNLDSIENHTVNSGNRINFIHF